MPYSTFKSANKPPGKPTYVITANKKGTTVRKGVGPEVIDRADTAEEAKVLRDEYKQVYSSEWVITYRYEKPEDFK